MSSEKIELDPELARAAEWLQDEIEKHGFGTFGIAATVHNGRVTKLERTATETLKPGNGGNNHAAENRER